MQGITKITLGLLMALLLAACASTAPTKQEMILGTWQADFGGQSMVLTYSATEIAVDAFGVSFPYEWLDADTIKLDAMGQEVISTVEFVTENQMIQRSTQGEQTLTRIIP